MNKDICGYCLDKEATTRRFFDICDFYGIKNKDLVNLFNVSNATVSYWRNGSRFPEWDKLMIFAYTVGLPLDVMIIGKRKVENEQIKKAITQINELKEKKYISKLQELLNNGDLDNPPKLDEMIFNPLLDRNDFIDSKSSHYARLVSDVKYYGLKKIFQKKELGLKQETEILDKDFAESRLENLYLNSVIDLNLSEEISLSSSSMYIDLNGRRIKTIDEYGNPLNGCRIDTEIYDKENRTIIIRFRNGYLDGDEFDEFGNFLESRPAVETVGHIEYWRNGYLHRDGKEAAVISNGFRTYEYWENGKRIK